MVPRKVVCLPHFPRNISTFYIIRLSKQNFESDVSASKTSYKKPAFHKTQKAWKALITLDFLLM